MEKLRKFTLFPFNCTDSPEIIYGDEPWSIMNSVFSWHLSTQSPGLDILCVGICAEPCTGACSVACNTSLYYMSVCICMCVHEHMCARVRVCVLISVPLCFASVQKGLVPTTWCRAASAPPIPAWIATLAANQKLPAAFAVCPFSIFSNTSLNLLASLGCCINPPHSIRSPYSKFLMSTLRQLFSHIASHECTETFEAQANSQQSEVTSACHRATVVLFHRSGWKHDLI